MLKKIIKGSLVALVLLVVVIAYSDLRISSKFARFRTSLDEPMRTSDFVPTEEGFRELNMSGSTLFVTNILDKLKAIANGKEIYVISLIENGHLYINEKPAYWLGYSEDSNLNEHPTNNSLRHKIRYALRRGFYTGRLSHNIDDQDVVFDRDLMKSKGVHHINLYYDRKSIPGDDYVSNFINLVKSIPEDAWIHFHCNAGRGRTTVAMVMYDIIHNAKTVPLKDILERNYLIGSDNLNDVTLWKNGTYTVDQLERRHDFVSGFYEYMRSDDGYGKYTWVEWLKANNMDLNYEKDADL